MNELVEGAVAPQMNLPRDGGGNVSLAELAGKKVVLYFYPKDDTSGCTTEALDFTALSGEFAKAGAVVIGLSPDPVKAHDKFIAKHDLGIALVSDAEAETFQLGVPDAVLSVPQRQLATHVIAIKQGPYWATSASGDHKAIRITRTVAESPRNLRICGVQIAIGSTRTPKRFAERPR